MPDVQEALKTFVGSVESELGEIATLLETADARLRKLASDVTFNRDVTEVCKGASNLAKNKAGELRAVAGKFADRMAPEEPAEADVLPIERSA